MISNEQYDYLRAHPTFERLTRDSFDQLAKHIRFRKIPKGQIFFTQRILEIIYLYCIRAMLGLNNMMRRIVLRI